MGGSQNYQALDWVQGEIEQTLKQAQQALEDFVDNPDDSTRMRFCLTHLHQIYGTLKIVEFYGATLLAEEMEQLAQAFLAGAITCNDDAIQTLMQAILQLPVYLDQVKSERREEPANLLPLLNDLRAARGERSFSEGAFFGPNIAPVPEVGQSTEVVYKKIQNLPTILAKIRQLFQYALVGLFKDQDVATNLGYLLKATLRMHDVSKGLPQAELWFVSAAMLDALKGGALDMTVAVKQTLTELDKYLKVVCSAEDFGQCPDVPEALFRDVLFYVAKGGGCQSERISEVKEKYDLDKLWAELGLSRGEANKGPDKTAIKSVVVALEEEMGVIKETLDLFVRGDQDDLEDLNSLLPHFKQIADTLSILGLTSQRKMVQDQIALVSDIVAQGKVQDEKLLLSVADNLVEVETSLAHSLGKGGDEGDGSTEALRVAREAVLKESRGELEQAKEGIVQYIASEWSPLPLKPVPGLLHSVQGSIAMVPLPQCEIVLERLMQYVETELVGRQTEPDPQEMELLADALTSVEYYLERFDLKGDDDRSILSIAEHALEALKYPVEGASETESETRAAAEPAPEPEPEHQAPAEELGHARIDDSALPADDAASEGTSADDAAAQAEEATAEAAGVHDADNDAAGAGGFDTTAEGTTAEDAQGEALVSQPEHAQAPQGAAPEDITFEPPAALMGEASASDEAAEPEVEVDEMAASASPELGLEPSPEVHEAPEVDLESIDLGGAAEASTPDELTPEDEIAQGETAETENAGGGNTSAEITDGDLNEGVSAENVDADGEGSADPIININAMLPEGSDDSEALGALESSFHEGEGPVNEELVQAETELNDDADKDVEAEPAIAEQHAQEAEPEIASQTHVGADTGTEAVTDADEDAVEDAEITEAAAEASEAADLDDTEMVDDAEEEPDDDRPRVAIDLDAPLPSLAPESAATEDWVDEEVVEIFVEEAEEVLEAISDYYPRWRANTDDMDSLKEVRRAFHTLKGSGRMVGANVVGEVAWAVENMLNRVIDRTISLSPALYTIIDRAIEYIPTLVEAFQERQPTPFDTHPLAEAAAVIAKGGVVVQANGPKEAPAPVEPEAEQPAEEAQASSPAQADGFDTVLLEIFKEEALGHLSAVREFLTESGGVDASPTNELLRALHTLKGCANMAGINTVADVVTPIERVVKRTHRCNQLLDRKFQEFLKRITNALGQKLQTVMHDPSRIVTPQEPFVIELKTHVERVLTKEQAEGVFDGVDIGAVSPFVAKIFLTESMDRLLNADQVLRECQANLETAPDVLGDVAEELNALRFSAQDAGLDEVVSLVRSLEYAYRAVQQGHCQADDTLFAMAHEAHDVLIEMMDCVANGLSVVSAGSLASRLLGFVPASVVEQFDAMPKRSLFRGQDVMASDASDQAALEPAASQDGADHMSDAQLSYERAEASLQQAPQNLVLSIDPEVVEVFLDEALDIMASATRLLEDWQKEPSNTLRAEELQREMHTLKGGARLAEIVPVGALAERLETLYEGVCDDRFAVSDELFGLLNRCHHAIDALMFGLQHSTTLENPADLLAETHNFLDQHAGSFEYNVGAYTDDAALALADETPPADEAAVEDRAEQAQLLSDSEPREDASDTETVPDESASQSKSVTEGDAQERDHGADTQHHENSDSTSDQHVVPTIAEPSPVEEFEALIQGGVALGEHIDAEVVDIFLEEAADIVVSAGNLFKDWQNDLKNTLYAEELQRDIHTLKGGARLAEIEPLSALAHRLEALYEGVCDNRLMPSDALLTQMQLCHYMIEKSMAALQEGRMLPDPSGALAQIDAFCENSTVFGGDQRAAKPEVKPSQTEEVEPTQPESAEDAPVSQSLQTLADDTEQAGKPAQPAETVEQGAPAQIPAAADARGAAQGELVSPLQKMLGDDFDNLDVEVFDIFLEEAEELTEQTDEALNAWLAEPENFEHGDLLKRLVHTFKGGARLAGLRELGDISHDFETFLDGMPEDGVPDSKFLQKTQQQFDQVVHLVAELRKAMVQHDEGVLVTPEGEIVDPGQAQTAGESEAPTAAPAPASEPPMMTASAETDDQPTLQVQDSAQHEDSSKSSDAQTTDPQTLPVAAESQDDVPSTSGPVYPEPKIQSPAEAAHTAASITAAFLEADGDKAVPLAPVDLPLHHEQKAEGKQSKRRDLKDARRGGGETVKIQSNLLEQLINLAGETSIFRGRVENEVSRFHHTIGEMNGTIERLRDLLRRLDIETEAHILYRHEKEKGNEEHEGYEDFDPLEMDRYSALNQLSRSLSESASDLTDLTETMGAKVRDAETLLVQQSRVNTELQEGLMRTQLEPFSKMIPRLRRIVRQVASELGKEVELEVVNAEGELDRNVLDRMVAPLEHMLRNAVDHGLETPVEREAAGKKRVGRVTLFLAREGGEVVIRLSDDGKGIATEAVKEKAIKKGLMKPNASLSDNDIMQFIFKPGFSTASKVTQISGRGVGMDVVNSEIKQLGGSMKIHSAAGVGTQFTVRLPFTVSVNRALMVMVGEDHYAIPLSNIEGIVRVSPYELMNYYKPDAPQFGYAGRQYVMEYLGRYVHAKPVPTLDGVTRPLPVLLLRSGENSVALQVDQLLGSREVVVKTLGPQLSTVSGISGATILGDGSVVIILDLLAMLRAGKAGAHEYAEVDFERGDEETHETRRTPLVMVVDDSVTVRKVTSRLLERHGLEVVLAKDGMDAITKLQEIKPDIMLLDIEMPRMDGFEVASQVRHSERLKELPIIMITSRTGEKHRNRALSLGVNKYMGKPFQETQLMENIQSLLKQEIEL